MEDTLRERVRAAGQVIGNWLGVVAGGGGGGGRKSDLLPYTDSEGTIRNELL